MARKYTVEIDAQVQGTEEVQELESSLDGVSTNADTANQSLSELNTTTEQASQANKEFGSVVDSNAFRMGQMGVLGYNLNRIYRQNTKTINEKTKSFVSATRVASRFFSVLKAGGPIILAASGYVLGYNKLLSLSTTFIESNNDALKEWYKTLESDESWSIWYNNIKLWVSEKSWSLIQSTADFWDEFANAVLYQFGGEAGKSAVRAGRNITDMLSELNDQSLLLARTGYILEDSLKKQVKILSDEDRPLKERQKAQEKALKIAESLFQMQMKELKLQREIVQERINAGDTTAKTQLRLAKLDEQIFKLNSSYNEQIDTMSTLTMKQKEYNRELEEVNWLVRENLKLRDEEARIAKLNEEGGGILAQPELTSEQAALMASEEEMQNHKAWLNDSLKDMGGMWGDYFGLLKHLYSEDKKWSELESQEKIATIAMTAQASLSIAGELINQLGAVASQDFETQKKYRIAGATVSTLQGMIGAFMGGVTTAPGPWGLVLGAVLAAATGAMGFANIKKIANSTPESPATSGDLGSSTAPIQQAPSFSLVNPLTAGEEALATGISTELEPVEAYVVSTKMSTQQELDRHIETNATI